jgi:nicotinate-nucleotide adenylyltransferase
MKSYSLWRSPVKNNLHRLGLFGGTFNPIHVGHLRLAEDVREEFDLDRIIFIPSDTPPHKEVAYDPGPTHRLNMVKYAIDENLYFSCDDVELRRGGVSYTVDTVRYVYDHYRFEHKPFFIIGSDLINQLMSWKDSENLIKMVDFIVLLRDNMKAEDLKLEGPSRFLLFDKRTIDVTSSEIRERLAAEKSVRYLVPEKVEAYIRKHRLYEHPAEG